MGTCLLLRGGVTIDDIYPVGSIYMSVNSTSPSTLFGGKWEKIATNRVLMGAADDSELNMTVDSGLPNITGYIDPRWTDASGGGIIMPSTPQTKSGWDGALYADKNPNTSSSWWSAAGNSRTGDKTRISFDASKSNTIYGNSDIVQPPALKVYIWKRTA